ncbi:MAG: alpha/beta-hydrolase N-terminal domain-containing protein [Pirellulales bacterium]
MLPLKSATHSALKYLSQWWASFSYVGLVFATLFFASSLTPSLLPRIYLVQGILSGFALACGYGVGVFFVWLWHSMQFSDFSEKVQRISKRITSVGVALVTIGFLWRATICQNSIRQLMEMDPIESADPWRITAIAIGSGLVLIVLARIFGWSRSRSLWRTRFP